MENFNKDIRRSPESDKKRVKLHHKQKRTTYFFQPQNTLAFRSNKSLPLQPPPPSVSHNAENQIESFTKPNIPIDSVGISTAPFPQHSSDDSFDGVRWRSGSTPKRKIDTKSLLSSPLKNSEFTRSPLSNNLHNEAHSNFVSNDLTESVLSKYGLGLRGPSQTPKNPRSQSDEGLPKALEISPSLQRSKSFDPRAINSVNDVSHPSKSSKLNIWIDKFATNLHQEESENTPNENPKNSVDGAKNLLQDNMHNEDEDSEDPFSDDDSLLAGLRADSFPPPTQAHQYSIESVTPLENLAREKKDALSKAHSSPTRALPEDETDPFSDDLDISEVEKCTVNHAKSLSEHKEAELLRELLEDDKYTPEELNDARLSFSRSDFVRYQVISVITLLYTTQNLRRKQLILTVKGEDEVQTKLIVRGEAAELSLDANDIIHIILTSPQNPKLVDNTHNLLIWNPDVLISSTVVADQLFCPRKTVLMKKITFPGETSIPLLVGTIVHEIFQACFISERSDRPFLEQLLQAEIQRKLIEIYTLGDIVDELEGKIREHFPFIDHWFKTFYKKSSSEIPTNKRYEKIKFSVAEVLDIEESVWSPMFGIKGNADVTLKANLVNENSLEQVLLPMEIKTSALYLSHQAQAALYALLFKDRYNFDISSFLLVYTKDESATKKYDICVADLKSLVNLRNRISYFLRNGQRELPDLMRQQKCDRCMVQESCMSLNYMTEDGTAEESGLKEGVYDDITSHLVSNPQYSHYYQYWNELLSLEEQFMTRFNSDIWTLSAHERETVQGKALANLIIEKADDEADNKFMYTFVREPGHSSRSMESTQILKYDKVIVSDQIGHFALSQGYVVDISDSYITIVTRRRIVLTRLKTDKFHSANVLRKSLSQLQPSGSAVVFRLDKDEIFYGMGVARFNILNLFLRSGDERRRRQIVDLEEPKFGNDKISWLPEHKQFNPDQKKAIERVIQAQDYSLVLGMPGTGKTTLIAHLIKMVALQNKSVLLTSYTNSAVDNILLKVKELGVDFVRIGNPARVHYEIREKIPGHSKEIKSFQDFQDAFVKPRVVAATCLSVNDISFNVRDHFDYCIIDEASQVSMPLSLGPLRLCSKFVLVGDHYQLPPLVTHPNPNVRKGLSRSLFEILAEAHPQSVTELTYQYRMCSDIMSLSNNLIYNDRLKCGTQAIAEKQLEIPNIENLQPKNSKEVAWLHQIFNPREKCVFFNHDPLNGEERIVGENVSNPIEVELIRQTIEGLCTCGVPEEKIGVVTLYRSQLKLLNQAMSHRSAIEILTADRFQGRDKECVIISLVRSNKDNKVGDLIKDWRRVNVAVTRAKSKLIVFGSISTLGSAPTISSFIDIFKKRGWIQNLPSTAKETYHFPQSQSSQRQLPKNQKLVRKLGNKVMGRHPVVQDILSEMNVYSS